MSNQYLNPVTLFDASPFGFSQAVVSRANGTAYLSGQAAWDRSGRLSGGADFAAQVTAALANVVRAAQAVGAQATDVVRVRVYIVNHTPDKLGVLGKAMVDCFGGHALPASTVIGVAALALPELLVEIEADVDIPPAR
jgi:enamine deaminase RidA (YjgF/YER057c/UK114 family)